MKNQEKVKLLVNVNDKVYDINYGWGKLIGINKNNIFPLIVEFNNTSTTYKLDGVRYNGNRPTLSTVDYSGNNPFVKIYEPEDLPILRPDTLIWVTNSSIGGPYNWFLKRFKGWEIMEDGRRFIRVTEQDHSFETTWPKYSIEHPYKDEIENKAELIP